MKKTIVISAIALRSGGTLSILQDCLSELSKPAYEDCTIYVIVKDIRLTLADPGRFHFIELDGTRSYFRRCYYEYFYFKKLSRKLKPDLWFSLHDMSPNVTAPRQVVYCHNPSPFYRVSWSEFFIDPKFGLFTWLYSLLYRVNIRKNSWVVVQQAWLREAFAEKFNLPEGRIIVAYPSSGPVAKPLAIKASQHAVFFYPLFPRIFKNVEVIGEAVRLLVARGYTQFSVVLTLTGEENRYSRKLYGRYSRIDQIKWIGQVSREEVFKLYGTSDCLIFPSQLETWGLPISEYKQTGKPILLSDLPYAHETGGAYEGLVFFDSSDPEELSHRMEDRINGKNIPVPADPVPLPKMPMAENWSELFKIILAF